MERIECVALKTALLTMFRLENCRAESKIVPIRGNRTLSAAARKEIAAAPRARWAKVKAETKTS